MATHKNKTTKKTHHKKDHTPPHHAKHHAKHAPKSQPRTMALIFGAAILLGAVFVMMNHSVISMDKTNTTATNATPQTISQEEKEKIKQWIIDENLNSYGDNKGTMYIGGTPLFDESTGKYKDLYEYILKMHPDRPWNN